MNATLLYGRLFLLSVLPVAVLTGADGCEPAEREGGVPPVDALVPTFTDMAVPAGLGTFRHVTGAFGEKWFPESMGAGGGFFDYDGDGWLDIVLVRGGLWTEHTKDVVPVLALFRNQGDGTFTDRTEAAGLQGIHAYGMGVTAADYDNDGDQDLYLTTLRENFLFRNDGGTFTDVTRAAGVLGQPEWSSAALFFDADRDGWLDLWVGYYIVWSPQNDLWCSVDGIHQAYCTPELYQGVQARFFHNNGDGTFVDWSEKSGLGATAGKTLGVAEFDYNQDLWPDVVVANDTNPTLLFENRGDGTFTEKGVVTGIAFDETGKPRAGMGIDAGDAEGTGNATVVIGNFANEMIGVYRNTGDGLFENRASVSRIGGTSMADLTFGIVLFDPDLDGDLDVLAGNGHIENDIAVAQEGMKYKQLAQLFVNDGTGIYIPQSGTLGDLRAHPMVARGIATGDVDRDGDPDVLVTENGGPAHLFRNNLITARGEKSPVSYLRVRLQGVTSNRDGIGSSVTVWTEGRRLERRVRTGSSYLSQSELVVSFGLGPTDRVDSLIVRWPSGRTDRLQQLNARQELTIVEGSGLQPPVAARSIP